MIDTRHRLARISSPVIAGQALLWLPDGTVGKTAGRPNCIACETIEQITGLDVPIKILMLQAGAEPGQERRCICGHSASQHRSNDDHCNAPGCSCTYPSCGH